MYENMLDKFPAILREKLQNNEISFPQGTRYNYKKIIAYRMICREIGDNTPVNKNDMKSYYEQDKAFRGVQSECDSSLYSVSLFMNAKRLKICLNFPRKNKKIAKGYVFEEGGPQFTNKETYHIDWWLYKNVDFSGFKVCKEDEV